MIAPEAAHASQAPPSRFGAFQPAPASPLVQAIFFGRDVKLHHHLYGQRWRDARAQYLSEHPLCECPHCQAGKKKVRPSSVVDHIIPHNGSVELFWDRSNWQALSQWCHDSYKRRLERTGRVLGAHDNGIPVDPNHHWHTQGG